MLASAPIDRVLVVGATGRSGRHVVAAVAAERIDYGVAHVMRALGGRRPRIVLMTTLSANLLT